MGFSEKRARSWGGAMKEYLDANPSVPARSTPAIAPPAPTGVNRGLFVRVSGWRPPSLNELMRGSIARRIALGKSSRQTIADACNGLPRAIGKRCVSLMIEWPSGQRRHDPDAFWKALGDGLTDARQLVNDSYEWVRWGGVLYARADTLATTIFIEEIG